MAGFALKPCPFCGAPAEIFRGQQMRDGHMTHYVLVRCTNCKAGTRRTDYPATEPFSEPEEQGVIYTCDNRPCKAKKNAVGSYILRKEIANGRNYLCGRKMLGLVRPNDFCSFGERKDTE